MKLTNLNMPARFTDDEFKDKEVQRFRIEYPSMILFKQSYDSEVELERDKVKWDMMGYEQRLISNEKSLRLFGAKNEDRYPKLKAKFTKADIKNKELPKVYSPSQKVYNEEFVNFHSDFKQALRLSEAWNRPFDYLNAIERSYDILEELYLIEAMQSLDTGKSILVNEAKKYALNLKERLTRREDDEVYPVGYFNESFFTPKEIVENHLEVPKKWFDNFKLLCYGVLTESHNITDKPVFEIENRPIYKSRSIYSDRLNEALSKEIFTNRNFIDLSYVSEYGVITEEATNSNKGVSIFFLNTIINNELVTRISIGLDPLSDEVYEFTRGRVGRKITVKDMINDKDDFLVVYFLPLSDTLYDSLSSGIKEMNAKNSTPKNLVQDICDKMNVDCPPIINDKLFYVHLAHCLLSMIRGVETNAVDVIPNKPIYSYIIYKGEVNDYDRAKVYSKLNIYSSKDLDTSHLQEGYFRMPKLDLQVLLESNGSNTIDKTGFKRVDYNEFVDKLHQFSVE